MIEYYTMIEDEVIEKINQADFSEDGTNEDGTNGEADAVAMINEYDQTNNDTNNNLPVDKKKVRSLKAFNTLSN